MNLAKNTKGKIPSEPYESGGGRKVHQDGSNRKTDRKLLKDNDLMEECIVCKRSFKKGRGLKIHQKKSAA